MESTTNDWLSKKALDIIRRAKEEKYTQIKLAGYGLEQLPDELFDLEELENLDISYNGFTELPPAIARMTHLRFLDLRGNNLQNLPAEISKLSELKHLDLSENPLQCLPEPILQLRELKYLEANTCNIILKIKWIYFFILKKVLYLSYETKRRRIQIVT